MTVTMLLDLLRPETLHSTILIADDLTMCSGVAMVWFKAFWWHRHHDNMVRLFVDLDRRYAAARSDDWRLRRVRRFYFVQDFVLFLMFFAILVFLYISFTLQPFVRDDKNLMYRAVFPWNTKSDVGYRVTCVLQFVDTTPVLTSILIMECTGVLIVNQVTMYLHMLRIKWERLGVDRSGALRDERTFQRFMEHRVGQLVKEHHSIMR